MKKIIALSIIAAAYICGCVPAELLLRNSSMGDENVKTIVIAALLPLTGNNKIKAAQMKDGITCAAEHINHKNGINGKKLIVEFIDTKGTPAGSFAALQEAEKRHAAAAITGYSTSEVSMLIKYAGKLQMPMVIPMATSDEHMDVSPFVYRNCFSNMQQMEILAAYLIHWRKLKVGAIITDLRGDETYAREVARDFAQAVADENMEIATNITIPKNAHLSIEQIKNVLSEDPEFILIAADSDRSAELVKKIRVSGFRGILCGPDSWDDGEFFNDLNNFAPGDCVFTAFFSDENPSNEYKLFKNDFRKKFLYMPTACSTQSYDALKFLAIALDKAENLIVFDKNWRTIRNHYGAAAIYTMLPKGNIDRTVYIKTIGVERAGNKIMPYPRLSKKLQHSKLLDYRIIE